MGVQPPSDDIDDGPEVVEFGIAALAAELEERDVSYPTDTATLREAYGQVSVPVDAAGTEITLESALEEAGQHRFESQRDLLNTLHPIFEDRRARASRSLLAQLRSLVPF